MYLDRLFRCHWQYNHMMQKFYKDINVKYSYNGFNISDIIYSYLCDEKYWYICDDCIKSYTGISSKTKTHIRCYKCHKNNDGIINKIRFSNKLLKITQTKKDGIDWTKNTNKHIIVIGQMQFFEIYGYDEW